MVHKTDIHWHILKRDGPRFAASRVWHGDLRSQAEVGSQSRSGESSRMLSPQFCGSNWETAHGGAWESMHWTVPISLAFLSTAVIWKAQMDEAIKNYLEAWDSPRSLAAMPCETSLQSLQSRIVESACRGTCGISTFFNGFRTSSEPIGQLGDLGFLDPLTTWPDRLCASCSSCQLPRDCWVFVEPQAVRRPWKGEYANIIQD